MAAELPTGWAKKRVDEIARVVGGSTPSSETKVFWNGAIPFVTPTDLTALEGRYLSSTERAITEEGRRAAGLEVLHPGSVLLATRASIGLAALSVVPVTTNQGFQNLVPIEGTDSLWLYYAISHRQPDLARLAAGTTFRELSRKSLQSLRLLVPALAEQRAIAAVLDAIDDAIEHTEAVIAATERLRGALLHELLTRGVPGWHSEWKQVPGLGTMPACWGVVRLGDCCAWFSGGTPSKDRAEYWAGELPWVSPKDMKRRELFDAIDRVTEAGARAGSRIVEPGTIFVVVRGMILAHSFPVAITRVRCAFNQDIKALVCYPDMSPDFLLAVLESRKAELLHLPTPSTHGTMRVITEELQGLLLPQPTPQEQKRIAELVAAIDVRDAAEHCHLGELKRAKDVWADALLSGRVRVPVGAETGR